MQDLYGHDSVCVMPNPLAKMWESNSGSQTMYATGLPTQPYKIIGFVGRNGCIALQYEDEEDDDEWPPL